MSQEAPTSQPVPTLLARVEEVINLLRPGIQSDGGDLELVEVTDEGLVRVRLHGACVGCPSAAMTLRMGVERHLQERVPEVMGVERVP
jgi:Fe-S cluster biogenesis protein NfuA